MSETPSTTIDRPAQRTEEPRPSLLQRVVRDPRIRAPVVLFALVMAALSAERLFVFLMLHERFAHTPTSDLLKAFGIGLRFDAWVACAVVVPLVAALAAAWPKLLASRAFRGSVAAYCAAVVTLVAFACATDYYFFEAYNERLNHKAIDYLQYGEAYAMIWRDYPVIRAGLVTLGLLGGLWLLFRRAMFPRGFDGKSVRRLLVWLAVAVPALVVGIRGTIDPIAISTAPAYFTADPGVSQLTLNGLFTLREALISRTLGRKDLAKCVALLPDDEALATSVRLLVRPEDQLLGDPDNPLRRITDTKRPQKNYNVVLVLLESMSWPYVGALGGEPDLTPTLNALAGEGLLFERCFAVGTRTSRAISGVIAGYPDLPGLGVITRVETENHFLTLGHLLAKRGYETMFIYGGQGTWDHMQAFLRSNGFSRTLFEDEFSARSFRTVLGWCDEDLFEQAHREFLKMGDRPFLAAMLTLSLHRPFEIPPDRIAVVEPTGPHYPARTCVRYTDWAIGRFLEKARHADYFNRTIFVLVADHRGEFLGPDHTAASYRIPLLIYAPGILGPGGRRVSTVCSQTDIAPTIMSLLGGRYEHSFFGSSVLDRPADAGLALMQNGTDTLWLMAGNADAVQVPFGGTQLLWRYVAPNTMEPTDANDPATAERCEELRRQGVALLQTATILFERGSYNLARQVGSKTTLPVANPTSQPAATPTSQP
jgi:phosphoglycerol transferase MdoB-like AlkP superfamily enzyme